MAVEGQQIDMPNEDDILVFKNHYKKLKAPFVVYADFACSTTRTGTVSTREVKTDKYQHHRPCGCMINVFNSIDGSSKPFLYRGEDCMDVFIQKIISQEITTPLPPYVQYLCILLALAHASCGS